MRAQIARAVAIARTIPASEVIAWPAMFVAVVLLFVALVGAVGQ